MAFATRTCPTTARRGAAWHSGSTPQLGNAAEVGFAEASSDTQNQVVESFSNSELRGEVWDDLPPSRAWKVVTRAILSAFYSHPWAWNEIGFGGPAYPRGYARLGAGQRESWERGA